MFGDADNAGQLFLDLEAIRPKSLREQEVLNLLKGTTFAQGQEGAASLRDQIVSFVKSDDYLALAERSRS